MPALPICAEDLSPQEQAFTRKDLDEHKQVGAEQLSPDIPNHRPPIGGQRASANRSLTAPARRIWSRLRGYSSGIEPADFSGGGVKSTNIQTAGTEGIAG